ncbi:universal stress protein UspA [Sphingorhabdus lutea]|uniref:Universal stress protein UspA n=1 Tax=Sphingorhabdus lutea TaxID=1913578 RepID=A0A1L3JF03_9SPHN|nr:universal stress protein [Sphingorhabdus lutea]APG63700.1 universal stress protein UspA [Sphingorhabdus lutea]
MEHILACIDASNYADSVCEFASWSSKRLNLPIKLLHIVQRRDAVAARGDLSGSIGLGVKGKLMEELVNIEAAEAKLQIERGRLLLSAGEQKLRGDGANDVCSLHRHGGIVENILEQEDNARLIIMGKRGASHEFATGHIGSKVERVVRASNKAVLVAARKFVEPNSVIFAYDASPAANRALERLANSTLFANLPIKIIMADMDIDAHRLALTQAAAKFDPERDVEAILEQGKPEAVIAKFTQQFAQSILVMGAYGHSPIRNLIVGSTTTAMIRTVNVPVLLVR